MARPLWPPRRDSSRRSGYPLFIPPNFDTAAARKTGVCSVSLTIAVTPPVCPGCAAPRQRRPSACYRRLTYAIAAQNAEAVSGSRRAVLALPACTWDRGILRRCFRGHHVQPSQQQYKAIPGGAWQIGKARIAGAGINRRVLRCPIVNRLSRARIHVDKLGARAIPNQLEIQLILVQSRPRVIRRRAEQDQVAALKIPSRQIASVADNNLFLIWNASKHAPPFPRSQPKQHSGCSTNSRGSSRPGRGKERLPDRCTSDRCIAPENTVCRQYERAERKRNRR